MSNTPDCNEPRKVPASTAETPANLTARLIEQGKAEGRPACDMPRVTHGVTVPAPQYHPFQTTIHHGHTVIVPPTPMGALITPTSTESESEESEETDPNASGVVLTREDYAALVADIEEDRAANEDEKQRLETVKQNLDIQAKALDTRASELTIAWEALNVAKSQLDDERKAFEASKLKPEGSQ